MKNNNLYLVALVPFVLLVASFSLDSYILDMAESYLLFLLSGLIFLCLIPIVLEPIPKGIIINKQRSFLGAKNGG